VITISLKKIDVDQVRRKNKKTRRDQKVKFEDVWRFKLVTEVVKNIITSYRHINLFPLECYEFYARITGRTLRVDKNWLFSFHYPS
ncbi:hypothetical protein KIN20_021165, partial [Parelaphostrongylus tenuis]